MENEEPEGRTILADNLVLKVGSVLAFLTVFGWAIWWASGVQSDLNSIKSTLAGFNRFEAMNNRLSMIEQYGSPQVLKVQADMAELKKDFELWKATHPVERKP